MNASQNNSTNLQSNTEARSFWLQMELDIPAIVQARPSTALCCPMCCAILQEADDDLLICPTCGLEVML